MNVTESKRWPIYVIYSVGNTKKTTGGFKGNL